MLLPGKSTATVGSRSWAYVDDLSPSHSLMGPHPLATVTMVTSKVPFDLVSKLSRSTKRPKLTTGSGLLM